MSFTRLRIDELEWRVAEIALRLPGLKIECFFEHAPPE